MAEWGVGLLEDAGGEENDTAERQAMAAGRRGGFSRADMIMQQGSRQMQEGRKEVARQEYLGGLSRLMIGVPSPGLYIGHSMPPTLQKSPKLNIYTKIYFKKLQ